MNTFGTPNRFDFTVATPGGLQRLRGAAAPVLPASIVDDKDFDRTVRFEMLDEKTGLFTINAFLWPDKKVFQTFTEKVFAKLRAASATTLLIDVQANNGGDDDMWKQGLLRYIPNKPYQHFSMYRKQVIEGRQSETEKVHTGLSLIGPRFVLDRPSGLREPELLQPDIVLPDSPLNCRGIIDALHARIP